MQAYDFSAVCSSGQTLYYNITSTTVPYKVSVIIEYAPSLYTAPYYSVYPTGDLIIPDSVSYNGSTYIVDSIGGFAFYNCTGLTSVTIPNSVNSIGYSSFSNCTGLTSIIIPSSVTSINHYAFSDCSGLTSITIPNYITTITQGTFYNCTGLTSVTIPTSVTSIGKDAFYNCTGLDSIICEAINPPSIIFNTFEDVDRATPIYVPCGSLGLYQGAQYWSEFTNYKCLVGLNDEIESKVSAKIYPNPTSDKAVLEFEGLNDYANVSVIDLFGRVIKEYKSNKQDSYIEIDVSGFAKGVYNVVLQNDKINITNKLIVR